MADIIKDEVLGELEFYRYVWWRSIGKSLLGQDVMVELLVQDENQEGILDVQRKAYQTYLENEEKYIREVPKYVLDYYKWNFEEIDRVVELEPGALTYFLCFASSSSRLIGLLSSEAGIFNSVAYIGCRDYSFIKINSHSCAEKIDFNGIYAVHFLN